MNAKTKLLFAMPGTGKTTWVKEQNRDKQETDRPAIDFDYRGTRFHDGQEIRTAQASLLNAFAKAGVRAITTFPQMINFDALNPNLFEVIMVLPRKGEVHDLVQRAIDRGDDKDQPFIQNYLREGERWRDDWEHIFNKYIAPRFPDAQILTAEKGQYFGDVIPDLQ